MIPINNLPIDPYELSIIESHYSISIDTEVIKFISDFNGEYPDSDEDCIKIRNKLYDGSDYDLEISRVFNTADIIEQLKHIDYIDEFIEDYEFPKDQIETGCLLPIAELYGRALYVAVKGLHKQSLYMIDHGDDGIDLLLTDFTQFNNLFKKAIQMCRGK